MSDSLCHNLSRLALAKAIKTPYEDDTSSEHWSKSIIFCQPFVEEMETKALRSNVKHTQHRDKKLTSKHHHDKPQKEQLHHHHQQKKQHYQQQLQQHKALHSSNPKSHKNKSRSHLPSDSDDSEISDKRPSPRPKSYPTEKPPRPKVRPASYEDRAKTKSVSHSRASSSSSATPLTEDDQAPEDHFRKHSLKHIPSDDKEPYYNRRSIKEIDFYYQQLYQQQQLQYQLALQQQMYYAQPVYFVPRMEENKRHSSRLHRPTNTDLRRRAEMLRTSSHSHGHDHLV